MANNAKQEYQQFYEAAKAREEQLAAQRKQEAQSAYDQNMAALGGAYAQRSDLLQGNYQSALEDIQRNYDFATGQVNSAADSALQQAYVSMMKSQRDLPEMLNAQGITGGLAESSLLGIRNNYGSNRGQLEGARGNNIAQLANAMAGSKGQSLRDHNVTLSNDAQQKMMYELQLRNNLANLNSQISSDYYQNQAQLDNAYGQQMLALGNRGGGGGWGGGVISSASATAVSANDAALKSKNIISTTPKGAPWSNGALVENGYYYYDGSYYYVTEKGAAHNAIPIQNPGENVKEDKEIIKLNQTSTPWSPGSPTGSGYYLYNGKYYYIS